MNDTIDRGLLVGYAESENKNWLTDWDKTWSDIYFHDAQEKSIVNEKRGHENGRKGSHVPFSRVLGLPLE